MIAESNNSRKSLDLPFKTFVDEGDFWRLVTCHFPFGSLGELIFGLVLLVPLVRKFEREMGTKKFGTFLFFVHFFGMFMELAITYLLLLPTSDGLFQRASGPYTMIGALMFLFNEYTPRLHPRFVSGLGFDFSEKAISYFLALQLLASQGMASILPAVCGFVSAKLVMSSNLPFRKWELPTIFYKCGSCLGAPLAEAKPSAFTYVAGSNRRRAGGAHMVASTALTPHQQEQQQLLATLAMSQAHAQRNGANNHREQFQETHAPTPPPEEAIETLMAMGFDRERVIGVLQQCENNLEVAANRLLGG